MLEAHQRVGEILTIHIGGREIQTTTEHPFFVRRWKNPNRPSGVFALQNDSGLATATVDPVISHFDWTAAEDLRSGDEVSTSDGRWLTIDSIERDGTETVVYNMTVEEWHTYFIGQPNWGFDVWVHNAHNLAAGEVPLGTTMTREGHDLVATLRRNGETIDQRQFVSGSLTPDEIALGRKTGLGWRIGDTENRALRAMESDLLPGDRLRLDGFFEPCTDCQRTMMEYANRFDIEIEYRFLDSANRVRVWSAQQGGYILIGA